MMRMRKMRGGKRRTALLALLSMERKEVGRATGQGEHGIVTLLSVGEINADHTLITTMTHRPRYSTWRIMSMLCALD